MLAGIRPEEAGGDEHPQPHAGHAHGKVDQEEGDERVEAQRQQEQHSVLRQAAVDEGDAVGEAALHPAPQKVAGGDEAQGRGARVEKSEIRKPPRSRRERRLPP
jgi:hypothetical protein